MSIAGIRSNRGDSYQVLVALDWTLTVLSDTDFEWLEVDSTKFTVDDVVIGKADGSVICCQCKKNQADFRAWSLNDLGDELSKAIETLLTNSQTRVCFYSRSDFGLLAKLCEYSRAFDNEEDYLANLTGEHKRTHHAIKERADNQYPGCSVYTILNRIFFEVSPDFDRMELLLRERLRNISSNSTAAYDALWRRIDDLGGRVGSGSSSEVLAHRLTKNDLEGILRATGSIRTPVMASDRLRASFRNTSAIGRSWEREIGGQRIPTTVLPELMAAIDLGNRSILLTGLPGSGKTCEMLNLQEALEERANSEGDLVPLFVQSREFSNLNTLRDRVAQGLPELWVEEVARLAEEVRVVVVFDSLDVLSIAREHKVLTYFLAQIDRLLSIPQVCVVTACRDFDRRYDRRIASRTWDCEVRCTPLDWESVVLPLLGKSGIDTTEIDEATREIVRNPRELALFVEIARREGVFNVVTSQGLAARYIDSVVKADPELGDAAVKAIEEIAEQMLETRNISIPSQRVNSSGDIVRRLRSLNVLQDTHNGEITFGHQTLLDVLVVSGAIRRGSTLKDFIERLPPVPFVRPSIRSFVAHLSIGDRREYRKQLRAVFTSEIPFQTRRLVAESFANEIPVDDDWPMLRELHEKQRDVFQVIYMHASKSEWHNFWLSHLVKRLKELRESEGIAAHVFRLKNWINDDPDGVFGFWLDVLDWDWVDKDRIARQMTYSLSHVRPENFHIAVPVLDRLLRESYSELRGLGQAVCRFVDAGVLDDEHVWRFVAGEVSQEDITRHKLADRLKCAPHDFGRGKEGFMKQRMVQSTPLLEFALDAIEKWSKQEELRFGETRNGYRDGFLNSTSYSDVHTQHDHKHIDSAHVLFRAVEDAVLNHAANDSEWWKCNAKRLVFSKEGALCYVAILGCIENYHRNAELIGAMLTDSNLMEFSLSYELAELINRAFIYLDDDVQDSITNTILSLWEAEGEDSVDWRLRARVEFVSAIPCHVRSPAAQESLDRYERLHGTMIRRPHIRSSGGWVGAPFSFEVFLSALDDSVVKLLAHYRDHVRDFDDFLVGGSEQVGMQLREASSRDPLRFLRLLTGRWEEIPDIFKDDILDGAANHLDYRFGELQPSNGWEATEKPDGTSLATQLLSEIELHNSYWKEDVATANALKACSHVIQDSSEAAKLVSFTQPFLELDIERVVHGESVDLIMSGINMPVGKIVEALSILAINLQESQVEFPDSLVPTLTGYMKRGSPELRALLLRRLPYLLSKNPELGWSLFDVAADDAAGLWTFAEPCLYWSYDSDYERVSRLLQQILYDGTGDDLETWGRISTLASLVGKIEFSSLIHELTKRDSREAWKGAATVWSNVSNIRRYQSLCFAGLEAGLKIGEPHSKEVIECFERVFREYETPVVIPISLIKLFFECLNREVVDRQNRLFGFSDWLNSTSQRDPEAALVAAECYFNSISATETHFYDHGDELVQLITRLFGEAEEREDADNGVMLERVVHLQDSLLALGVNSVSDWLKAAERP